MNTLQQAEMHVSKAKRKKDVSILREIMTETGLTEINAFFAFMDIMKEMDESTFADAFEDLTADESARFLIHFYECLVYWWDVDMGEDRKQPQQL